MTGKRMLPIGIEFFDTMIRKDYYYIDKTGLIVDLLRNQAGVTLFTRPRRFGKSLNMSMLENFFSIEKDQSIFAGLRVSEEKDLCEQYMGKYPVISVSLKGIQADRFEDAGAAAASVIREEAMRYECLRSSERLSQEQKEAYIKLLRDKMDFDTLTGSLRILSQLLERHYSRKVILLIDEYDVPLAKAHEKGYYDQMVTLIRNLFEQGVKTNSSLEMAVLTGCMRVSKESIFTGLNNLRVLGVGDARLDEYFGFTDGEVRDMLAYYDLADHYGKIREWYDGYRFGRVNVYCPWDVVNYCDLLRCDPEAEPENFWANSSGNSIVRELIAYSGNASVQDELERLVNGEAIEKTIRQDLTYPEMYDSIDNIWSVLYTTGYLTSQGRCSGNRIRLVIPNMEVRTIFAGQILGLFEENVRSDEEGRRRLWEALRDGEVSTAEESLNDYLARTISIRDTAVRNILKENFYHGLLVGILSMKDDWRVNSNSESGDGYSDILVRDRNRRFAMVIEVKYAEDGDVESAARAALQQIEEKRYAEVLRREKFTDIRKYGIAFHLKECAVTSQ